MVNKRTKLEGIVKRTITNMAATVIIYKKSDPNQIFLEKKDDTHPIKLVRNQLCTVGGNWIGENAANDRSPSDTLARELGEEWTFARPMRSSKELALMGMAEEQTFSPTTISGLTVNDADVRALDHIKGTVIAVTEPYGDWINTIPRAVLDQADPENKRDGFSVLISYFMAGLDDGTWRMLEILQNRFGNISAESLSVMTSLKQIIQEGTKTAFGHDQVLQHFFRFQARQSQEAKRMPIVDGIESEFIGKPHVAYSNYLKEFNVLKKPI